MPAEFGASIDAAQKKLEDLQNKEKNPETQEGFGGAISKYQEAFFSNVDDFQNLEQTLQLSNSPEAQKHFGKGKREVLDFLLKIAARGQYLYEQALKDKNPSAENNDKKAKESVSRSGDLSILALGLRNTLQSYKENITTIAAAEKQFQSAQKAQADIHSLEISRFERSQGRLDFQDEELGESLTTGLDEYSKVKKILVNATLPKEFHAKLEKEVNDALKKLVQQKTKFEFQKAFREKYARYFASVNKKYVPTGEFQELPEDQQKIIKEEFKTLKIRIEENILADIEAKSCPKVMENFWNGKALLEKGSYEEGIALLQRFMGEDVNKSEFTSNPQLKAQKEKYMAIAKELLSNVEQFTGYNQDYFAAQKAYLKNDLIEAKRLLKNYLYKADTAPESQKNIYSFLGTAKELLKKIGLNQCMEVKAKFDHAKAPSKTIWTEHGMIPNLEYEYYSRYLEVLENIRKGIEKGTYVDFNDAYKAESAGKDLDPNYKFNFLADASKLEKGRAGLLELARKYRANGQYDLAEAYFMSYFSPKLEQMKTKQLSKEEMRKRWLERPKFMISIKEKLDELRAQYRAEAELMGPEWEKDVPWSDEKARQILVDQALDALSLQDFQKIQQDQFQKDPSSLGSKTEQEAWSEFMNMKGMHRQGTWAEAFSLSDAEMDQLIQQLPLDIALGALTAGAGAMAGRAVTSMLLRRGMTQIGKEALEVGASSLSRRVVASGAGLLVENTVSTLGNTAIEMVRSGEIASLEEFGKEWRDGLKNMAHFRPVSRVMNQVGLSNLSTVGQAGKKAGEIGSEVLEAGMNVAALRLDSNEDYTTQKFFEDAADIAKDQVGQHAGEIVSRLVKRNKGKSSGKKPVTNKLHHEVNGHSPYREIIDPTSGRTADSGTEIDLSQRDPLAGQELDFESGTEIDLDVGKEINLPQKDSLVGTEIDLSAGSEIDLLQNETVVRKETEPLSSSSIATARSPIEQATMQATNDSTGQNSPQINANPQPDSLPDILNPAQVSSSDEAKTVQVSPPDEAKTIQISAPISEVSIPTVVHSNNNKNSSFPPTLRSNVEPTSKDLTVPASPEAKKNSQQKMEQDSPSENTPTLQVSPKPLSSNENKTVPASPKPSRSNEAQTVPASPPGSPSEKAPTIRIAPEPSPSEIAPTVQASAETSSEKPSSVRVAPEVTPFEKDPTVSVTPQNEKAQPPSSTDNPSFRQSTSKKLHEGRDPQERSLPVINVAGEHVPKSIDHSISLQTQKDKEILKDIRNAYSRDAFISLFERSVDALRRGNQLNEKNPFQSLLKNLSERDPASYELILKSDVGRLVRTDCLEAIIAGDKKEFKNDRNQTVTMYVGKSISDEGMTAEVHNVVFTVGDKSDLQFGAVKKARIGFEVPFSLEVKAAQKREQWNPHPNLIQPLVFNDEYIIYETSEGMNNLKEIQKNGSLSDTDQLTIISDITAGISELHLHNSYHGDLKPANILVTPDKTAKIIDITPQGFPNIRLGHLEKFKPIYNDEGDIKHAGVHWNHTPRWSITSETISEAVKQLKDKNMSEEEIKKWIGRSIDAAAVGKILEETLQKFPTKYSELFPNEIAELNQYVKDLKNPVISGNPHFLNEFNMNILRIKRILQNANKTKSKPNNSVSPQI